MLCFQAWPLHFLFDDAIGQESILEACGPSGMSSNPKDCNHGRVYVQVLHCAHLYIIYSCYTHGTSAFASGATVHSYLLGVRGRGNNWEGGFRVPRRMATWRVDSPHGSILFPLRWIILEGQAFSLLSCFLVQDTDGIILINRFCGSAHNNSSSSSCSIC